MTDDDRVAELRLRLKEFSNEVAIHLENCTKFSIRGQHEAADRELGKAMHLCTPAEAAMRFELGILLYKLSRYVEAIRELQLARLDLSFMEDAGAAIGACFEKMRIEGGKGSGEEIEETR